MQSRPASAALHSFFEGAPFQMGISELTPEHDMLLVSVNPAAAAALGLTPEQVQGKRISELGLAGPGKGVWLEQYLQALETRRPVNFEQPSGVPGTDNWWEVTLAYIGNGPGGQPRFSYVVQDVTQRKRDARTQSALFQISQAAQSEETLPQLFRKIHEIIGDLLPARNFFVALHDKRSGEITFPYHVDEFDEPPTRRLLDDGTLSGRVIRLGQSLLFTPDTPNEGIYYEDKVVGAPSLDWLGVPLKTKSGTLGAMVVQSYAGDVRYTDADRVLLEFVSGQAAASIERRIADEALRLSESRLEEAQRLAHLGSWNWEWTTGEVSWSDELCRIYGVDPATHVPSVEDFFARLHPDERARITQLIERALADKQPFSHETRICRSDGEVRDILDQSMVLVDETGRVTGMAGACLDITERKRSELLELDRGRILEHVVQNEPLAGILARIADMLEHQRPGMEASVQLIGQASDQDEGSVPGGWSQPILSAGGGKLGTIRLSGAVARDPGEDDLSLLESGCRLAAVAIEHRQLTDKLSHQAQHDALTGLPNRLLFQDRLGQALTRASRNSEEVAVIYMDLDRFKHINDTLGHSSGDDLLRQAADRLQQCIRRCDTLARLGGDEFTVVLSELSDPGDAMRAAKNMIEAMRVPFMVDGRELFVTMSLGISVFPVDGVDAETLMVNADVAMYRAKEMGRDNFQWFAAEMNELARERMELEGQLRHAMALGQLSLAYQPQCDANGRILALEALLRWQHPTLGSISPSRFIPVAEDSGLIVPIGEWILHQACAQTERWRRAGHPSLRISVNVSAAQFNRADWASTVRRALQDTQLAPDALELEITESLLLQSVRETSTNLYELRAMGVGVAIDDFGTGYSSLSYLHKLPISTLKIDQSFVREIGEAPVGAQEDAPIIRTIIALAHNLGMSVVAEGVETEAQRQLLVRLGCEGLQGHLLHRALSVEQVTRLLEGQVEPAT